MVKGSSAYCCGVGYKQSEWSGKTESFSGNILNKTIKRKKDYLKYSILMRRI